MESYVRTWGDVQEMARSGQFTPGYIQAVIRDSQLSDIQKIKMRDPFAGMYD